MPFDRTRLVAASLSLATALGFACSGTTGPDVTAMRYSLTTVDGVFLPVGDKLSPGNTITDATIDFVGRDSAEVRETSKGAGSAIRLDRIHVDRNGSTLVFRSYAAGVLPDTGALAGTQLTLRPHVQTTSGQVIEQRVYSAR